MAPRVTLALAFRMAAALASAASDVALASSCSTLALRSLYCFTNRAWPAVEMAYTLTSVEKERGEKPASKPYIPTASCSGFCDAVLRATYVPLIVRLPNANA